MYPSQPIIRKVQLLARALPGKNSNATSAEIQTLITLNINGFNFIASQPFYLTPLQLQHILTESGSPLFKSVG